MFESVTPYNYYKACMYLVAWILFKLVNNSMFYKFGKQFWKQYNILIVL